MAQIRINTVSGCRDVVVPWEFIREHMHSASGDHIKVYLLLLDAAQNGIPFDTSEIADKWESTERDVNRSLAYWEKKGLIALEKNGKVITGVSFVTNEAEIPVVHEEAREDSVREEIGNTTPEPIEEAPKISTKITITPEMYVEASNDESFQELLMITQKYSKKLLNPNDYELFLHFYYRMKKDANICELIIEHCADKNKLSMRTIDKISCECLEQGITNRESVKYHLNRKKIEEDIIQRLALQCKKLPAAQLGYLNKWFLDYHFSEEMVMTACDRGALKTNGDNVFQYVDSILESWYREGITDLDAVKKKDEAYKEEQKKKYGSRGKKPSSAAGENSTNKFNRFEQSDINFDEDEALFIQSHISQSNNS